MRAKHPDVDVVEARLVDCGPIVTAGGVSLAIDATLHLIERACGAKVAAETARLIEYQEAWRANKKAFPAIEKSGSRRAVAGS
jgi:transcriptional regulator GlxA family with amidase domain